MKPAPRKTASHKKQPGSRSIVVRFGKDAVKFSPSDFKVERSLLTIPTAWAFKPMSEISFEIEFPGVNGRRQSPAKCRGIVLSCRPQKRKGHFHVDLFPTQVSPSCGDLFDDLRPHLPLCLEISCDACRWNRAGLSNTRGPCTEIQEFKKSLPVPA